MHPRIHSYLNAARAESQRARAASFPHHAPVVTATAHRWRLSMPWEISINNFCQGAAQTPSPQADADATDPVPVSRNPPRVPCSSPPRTPPFTPQSVPPPMRHPSSSRFSFHGRFNDTKIRTCHVIYKTHSLCVM